MIKLKNKSEKVNLIEKNMKKTFIIITATLLFTVASLIAEKASAAITIDDISLNGGSNLAISTGDQITAGVTVTLTDSSSWGSTSYKFGEGDWICIDTPDHFANSTATETILITTPSMPGVEDVKFEAYSNNNCTNDVGMTMATASLSEPTFNLISLGAGRLWLLAFLFALVITVILIIAPRVIKKILIKNNFFG